MRVVGGDRVIELRFGSGNWTHHLLVEFYAAGNIVLCDCQARILSVLRAYSSPDGQRVAARYADVCWRTYADVC